MSLGCHCSQSSQYRNYLHFQSLFPSLLLGGLGGLGVWSFSKKIDDAEMRADDAFDNVKDNVERRYKKTIVPI